MMDCVILQENLNPMGETKVTPANIEVMLTSKETSRIQPMARCFFGGGGNILLERGPLQILSSGFDFPVTSDNRHFSEDVYFYQ